MNRDDPRAAALALLLEQQEAAVDRQVLEDQVHDLVEHGLDVVGGDERLGDLDEDLEDLVLVGDVEDDALAVRRSTPGSGLASFSRPKSRLNSAIGRMQVEVESSSSRGRGLGHRRLSRKRSRNVPIVTWSPSVTAHVGTGRSLTRTPLVDWLSWRTQAPFSLREVGVPARDGEVVQDDVVVGRPPDRRDVLRRG